ncbi:AMP-binding protein [Streptomyces sp. G44]|uniref:AMP-binding protein n=1 Tax=Streptomyces sp. G44 TaxID=2807632 RepID=UPI0027DAEF76|nr:AMP-binding protein [Streptomyces sp. G44]
MRSVEHGLTRPDHQNRVLVEVTDDRGNALRTYRYRDIRALRDRLAARLDLAPGTRVGLVAANTPEWVVADLTLLTRGLVEVPVPLAFSAEQAASLLEGTRLCLTDEAGERRLRAWGLDRGRAVLRIPAGTGGDGDGDGDGDGTPVPACPAARAPDVVKEIHTSGTTGRPKGVRVRGAGLEALLGSLSQVVPDEIFGRYLSLVPFSLLIEQVTALYMPVRTGGTLVLLPADTALLGTAGSRAEDAVAWLRDSRATAAVLPPAVVSALDKAAARAGGSAAAALFEGRVPFLMAGGAPVDPAALHRLGAAGIEVYEGYGLSENSSVVSWNRPGENTPGTVGRPLPHCEVRIGDGGELLVRSASLFAGYTVEDPTSRPVDAAGWLHTGDRATLDAEGRITLLGRLKNMIITGHGRNVSPEWVEGRLRSCGGVREAVIFGEGLEHLVALVLTDPGADPERLRETVLGHAARELAETDRPERVITAEDTPELRERYFTVTGRPRREALYAELVVPALASSTALPASPAPGAPRTGKESRT